MKRSYDFVLFGATGFTGELTAAYLARTAPAGARWALAGRNKEKLTALRDRLGVPVPLLHADVNDPGSLAEIAAEARVIVSTVGPYIEYGEPLVAACAEAGTDYADLTGEPEFVDRMYLKYHETAVRSGARIVHACGFDSIPYDLGAYFTVLRLPPEVPLRLRSFLRVDAAFSSGTMRSAVLAFARARETWEAHRQRRAAEPALVGRHVGSRPGRPHRHAGLGAWALPMPTVDPEVVRRSATALDRYGPDFDYRQHLAVPRLTTAVGLVAGAAGLLTAARIPPVRDQLLRRLRPGDGPSEAKRAKSWFTVHFVGEGGGRRVITRVAGGDPGYGETAKMLGESALCLAFDDLPPSAGQVTTAQAMGDALIDRLQDAGLTFEVLARRG